MRYGCCDSCSHAGFIYKVTLILKNASWMAFFLVLKSSLLVRIEGYPVYWVQS